MSFDKLDKKIQEAAEQHSSGYSEDAWLKMEVLLDEHMPQNKEVKRKPPLAWIFALLLIVTGGVLLLAVHSWNSGKKDKQVVNIETANPVASNDKSNSSTKKIATIETNKNTGQKEVIPANNLHGQAFSSTNVFNKKLNNNSPIESLAFSNGIHKDNTDQLANSQLLTSNDFEHQIINNISIDNKKLFAKNISINKSIKQIQISKLAVNTKPGDKAKDNKFNNLFSLNFSAGPDVSAVNVNNIGTVKLLYGAGLGYDFAKRWQVRAGIYSVKKVYDASPSDYHPPTNFWNYYPNLEDVNANCNVIEVPIIVNYKFSQNSKQAWFAAAGLSSYFMKRETYNYHSKLAPGQYQDKSYTIENQNNHYLSSLRLSAGYEKKFNKIISLSAEPYLNLPLSGIGYGKVKLSSAGLLFSVSVKPFVKK